MCGDVLTTSADLENNKFKIDHVQYKNCISLGWFCGCASSLSKLGLRSASGPFDWYFSDLWAVLEQIENAFKDFMRRENLKKSTDNHQTFIDTKYGFCCNHDIQESFEDEIDEICIKYHKRAQRFLDMITNPTLFIRIVKDENEVNYINRNWKKAENIIKKYNSKNCIIYVVVKSLDKLSKNVLSFCLEADGYVGKTYEMRHLFDTSNSLINFLSTSISNKNRIPNLEFDKRKNYQKMVLGYVDKCLEEDINGIDSAILKGFRSHKIDSLYLWGAGEYGMRLANYLIKRNVNISGIIDNSYTTEIRKNEIPISGFDLTQNYKRIFIAVASEKANEDIVHQINNSNYPHTPLLRFKDLNFNIDL